MTTEQQAYIEGFLSKCAAAGVDAEALTKAAGIPWQNLWQIIKAFGKGTARRFGTMAYDTRLSDKPGLSPKVLDMLGTSHPFTRGYKYGPLAAAGGVGAGVLGGTMLGGGSEQSA